MAFTAASLSSFSISTTTTRRLSLLPPKPTFSFSPKPSPSSLKLAPIRASSDGDDTNLFEYSNPGDEDEAFPFQEPPEGYIEPPAFDEGPMETEEEIAAAYEAMYGPAYSGVSVLEGNDVLEMDAEFNRATLWGGTEMVRERVKDGFEERVVQVRRVTKVTKGGKNLQFRAVVVVGDRQGHVGVGVGKAKEISDAVMKSAVNARRNMIKVPMTKYLSFPHRADGEFGAAKVMLKPSSAGSGVSAGGAVRVVLELAGIENGLGKQLRSKNTLNNARATLVAIQKMRQFSEVAEDRGIPMEQLWQ